MKVKKIIVRLRAVNAARSCVLPVIVLASIAKMINNKNMQSLTRAL